MKSRARLRKCQEVEETIHDSWGWAFGSFKQGEDLKNGDGWTALLDQLECVQSSN